MSATARRVRLFKRTRRGSPAGQPGAQLDAAEFGQRVPRSTRFPAVDGQALPKFR